MPHIGSWGLPDFEITERIGDFFGQGRTAQGGSALRGTSARQVLVPSGINNGQTQFVSSGSSGAYGVQAGSRPAPGFVDPNRGVQGAATGPGGGVQGGGQPASFQPDTQPTQDPYSPIYSALDQQINWLPQQQQEITAQIEGLAGGQRTQVESERDAILAKFPGYREEVAANQKSSLSDLAGDVRNLLQAGNVYLGARGASDSSAGNMYAYALQQEGNKRRADILKQSGKMYNDLNTKETDVKTTAAQQLGQIENWKASQIASIAQDFMNKRNELMMQKGNVKSQSLAFWWDRLNQIDQMANQYKTAVSQWGQQRLADISNYKAQLGQMGNFSPEQIVTNEIANIPQFQQDADMSFQMMFPRLKDERNQIASRLI